MEYIEQSYIKRGFMRKCVRVSPKLQTVIKRLIMDGFQILRCLQKCMDILLQTIILEFSKTKKHGSHLGLFKCPYLSHLKSYRVEIRNLS